MQTLALKSQPLDLQKYAPIQRLPVDALIGILQALNETDLTCYIKAQRSFKPISLYGHQWVFLHSQRFWRGTQACFKAHLNHLNRLFDNAFDKTNNLTSWRVRKLDLNGFQAEVPFFFGSDSNGIKELPNGQFAITGNVLTNEPTICLFAPDGNPLRVFPVISMKNLHISSDEANRIVLRENDGTAFVWASSNRPDSVFRWAKDSRQATTVLALQDNYFATGFSDGTVSVWDPKGQLIGTHRHHMTRLFLSELLPNGRFAMVSQAGAVSVTHAEGTLVAIQDHHYMQISCIKASPDRDDIHFVTGDILGKAIVWNGDCDLRYVLTPEGVSKTISQIAFLCRNVIVTSSQSLQCFWSDGKLFKKSDRGQLLVNLSGSSVAQYGPNGAAVFDSELRQTASLSGRVRRMYSLSNGNILTVEAVHAKARQTIKLWAPQFK